MFIEKKRWLVLISLAFINFSTGAIYVWSIFNIPLVEATGWPLNKVSMAYSLLLFMTFVGNLIAGIWQKKRIPRIIIAIGIILWCMGWIFSGFVHTLVAFYFTFGVMAGFGNGFIYNTIVATIPKWFPDKKGMANGIVIGAGGLGPILISPIGYYLIRNFDVFQSFTLMGIGFIAVMMSFMGFVQWPTKKMVMVMEDMSSIKKVDHVNRSLKEMIHMKSYYLLWYIFLAITSAGLIMTGHASNIGQQVAGITAAQGTKMVGLFAIMSFSGRILMGVLSDRIGSLKVVGIILMTLFIAMIGMSFVSTYIPFILALSAISFCFGSTMCIFPKIIAEQYGTENIGSNWSVFFSAYTVSAFLGPLTAATFFQRYGNYDYAFFYQQY